MRQTVVLVATTALSMLLASAVAVLTAVPSVGQTATVTLVGAGDIASCYQSNDSATANLLDSIPGTVFTVGDNVQGNGTWSEFRNCYAPTWGRHWSRTRPSVGNHEYYTAGARPYFDYFGWRAGAYGGGYYSYNRGSWHIVALNSNCALVGGCGPFSPQGRWLRSDLAVNPARCTLAYFHHPLYASGTGSDSPEVLPLWNMLYRRGADVIISAHAHRYERFAPITPSGIPDPVNGIRQFIVGTGGEPGAGQSGPNDPNVQVKNIGTPGVLRVDLAAGSYSWQFVPIAGYAFTDWGSYPCH